MKQKIYYGCLAGAIIFSIASLIAANYNYGYELYLIGMFVCSIVGVTARLCNTHILSNAVIFLVAFFIMLFAFLFGALPFMILGPALIAGWVFIEKKCLKA